MPLIDQLLPALRGLDDRLVLVAGQPATLTRDGTESPATRRALEAGTIEHLLREVASEALAAAAPGRPAAARYRAGGREVEIAVESTPAGWSARVRLLNPAPEPVAAPAAPPEPTPLTRQPEAMIPEATAPIGPPLSGDGTTPQPLPAIDELLELLVGVKGSDLHLTSGETPRVRVDGDLQAVTRYAAPSSEELWRRLAAITPERNRLEFEERNDSDFAYELRGIGRFRVNLFRDRLGVGTVMRQIPEKIPTADDLGLPEAVRSLAWLAKGLVLVTGPTGSGKSTTLAALLDLVNRTRDDHIITIEDPVEFVHRSRRCLVNQREVHVHTHSFKQALRAALREDPDIVLVGEMRDLETIAIAIETAETGHLVFGTLHTTTAISTVERLVDQFPGERQGQVRMMLADSLKAVIAQTLLKKVGGGRVAAMEILLANPAVSNLIREAKAFQLASAMQTGRKQGMILMNDALVELVRKNLVEPREAWLKAVDKDGLLRALRSADIPFEPPAGAQ